MRPIPKKLRDEMAADPWYSRCCISGVPSVKAKIEFHHAFIFAGRQVNEKWCIIPVAASIHEKVSNQIIREKIWWIILNRADLATLQKYSRSRDLVALKWKLNQQYGVWKP